MNKNLNKAKSVKVDEFYTQLPDIERELKHYWEHFRGKVVYCNCDDPSWSKFFLYFSLNFKKLGLRRLITTHYSGGDGNSLPAFRLIYNGEQVGNEPDLRKLDVRFLEGDGDFRSPECVELLKQADIVVTNPPFSLFREFVDQLVRYKKQFLIIGNDNAITYKGLFKLIKDNKIWLGYGKVKEFARPDRSTQKFGNIGWYTNLEAKKRHEELVLYRTYVGNEQDYPKYDNYDAIEVSRVKDIPMDYVGVMGVPINFLDKHNPDQFELIGCNRDVDQDPNGVFGKGSLLNQKETFKRLFIQRRDNHCEN